MKSTKTFNNISDTLKKQIPKLKPGERILFQMLNGVPNPEPDEKERAKQGATLFGKRQLLTHFTIYDKHLKNETGEEVGGNVDVGCVDVWVKDNPERYRTFVPGLGGASFFQGKFELLGGKISDEELFEILWLSPERKGTPCPDDNIEQVFEIINVKAEGQKTLSKVDTLYKVLGIVKEATTEEMLEYMASLNQPTYQDPEVLKAKVSGMAKDDPDGFLRTWNSPFRKQTSTIKRALDSGVITYDLDKGEVKIGKETVTKIKVEDYSLFPDAFSTWVSAAENGEDVMKNIENQLSAKEKVEDKTKQ